MPRVARRRPEVLETERGRVRYWAYMPEGPAGSGQACVLLLHGLLMDHRAFAPQVPALSARLPVLAWDAPLHGASWPYRDFSVAHAAQDARALVRRAGFSSCVAVGQGMGAVVARHLALENPGLVAGLALIDEPAPCQGAAGRARVRLARLGTCAAYLCPADSLPRAVARRLASAPSARDQVAAMLEDVTPYEVRVTADAVLSACAEAFAQAPATPACPTLRVMRRPRGRRDTAPEPAPAGRVALHDGRCATLDDPELVTRELERLCAEALG